MKKVKKVSKFKDAVRKGEAMLKESEARAREDAVRRKNEEAEYHTRMLIKAREWVSNELPALITAATVDKSGQVSLQNTGSGIPPEILAQACREEPDLRVGHDYVPANYDPDGAYTHDGYTAYYVSVKP